MDSFIDIWLDSQLMFSKVIFLGKKKYCWRKASNLKILKIERGFYGLNRLKWKETWKFKIEAFLHFTLQSIKTQEKVVSVR